MAVRKAPVLLALQEESLSVPVPKKAFLGRIKELKTAKRKEILSIENIENLKVKMASAEPEENLTRQEEFDQEPDYWDKVKSK